MFPIPSIEKLVETKTCKQCKSSFPITDKDLKFYDNISPVFGWNKCQIPAPTLCPECRQQRRLTFRNERKLYKRNCDATGKSIVSIYSPDKSYKVYHQDYWWSDRWNALDYWKDFDFSRNFFEQYAKLQWEVPRMSLFNKNTQNSEYNNYIEDASNCFMSFRTFYWCEDIYYSYLTLVNSRSIFDCTSTKKSETLYDCVECNWCFSCFHSCNLNNSSECLFSYNLTDCKNCFLCSNLISKEYYIQNVSYSKSEYEKKIKDFLFKDAQTLFPALLMQAIKKESTKLGCEECSGEYMLSSNRCHYVFNSNGSKDCKYSYDAVNAEDVYDLMWVGNSSQCNDSININHGFQVLFTNGSFESKYLLYCDNCFASEHLFGCIGLRDAKYCILNKQYTREEYEELVPKIIEKMIVNGEWWEFFPSSLSLFWYNETAADEYYSISKQEALTRGFNWSDYEAPFPKVEKIIPASKLPDDITKIPDDILNWAIECEVTGKPFRIIKQELEFYRKHNLPIPRRHPDQRHLDRMSLRNPRKLFERKCDKCHKDILATYTPERSEIVYCEECYNKEII